MAIEQHKNVSETHFWFRALQQDTFFKQANNQELINFLLNLLTAVLKKLTKEVIKNAEETLKLSML